MRPALDLLKNKQGLIGAEIGVFHGNYTLIYLEKLDIKKVYLIDPYVKYKNYDRYQTEALNGAKKDAHEKLSVHNGKVKWIELMSSKAVLLIEDESLDFVYIDGNHGYKVVLQDITLYYPKVKKGGLVSGHDYRADVRDHVYDATNDFCKENNLILSSSDRDWWFWK